MNRRTPPERIGAIVEAVLAERGYLTACREYQVAAKWPEIVGERLAKVTECTKAENGVLYVRVSSASWRQDLAYMKHVILQKVKTLCSTITDIVFC